MKNPVKFYLKFNSEQELLNFKEYCELQNWEYVNIANFKKETFYLYFYYNNNMFLFSRTDLAPGFICYDLSIQQYKRIIIKEYVANQ